MSKEINKKILELYLITIKKDKFEHKKPDNLKITKFNLILYWFPIFL